MMMQKIEPPQDPPPEFDSTDLGSPKKVWSLLCEKDEKYKRDPLFFKWQHNINTKMRSMLLEWLMDVCNDKNLHRETFHLCVDYIDRYLCMMKEGIQPQRLQLIGATALVVASKIEEVYPPRISEIAEYTDGCCTEQDLRDMEEQLLQQLEWNCYPITALHWLSLYMQLMSTNDVIRAQQVVVTAVKEKHYPSQAPDDSPSASVQMPSVLNVSIVLSDNEDEKPKLKDEPLLKVKHEPEGEEGGNRHHTGISIERTPGCHDDRENCQVVGKSASKLQANNTSKRTITFNSYYPRMQLAHIGGSPRLTLRTGFCDISYVGKPSYSTGHIYPDQRCTVPKLMRGEFVRMAMILDMVILDPDSLRFRYRELATAVLLCSYEPEALICKITGFKTEKLRAVREFVDPFVQLFDQLEPTGTQVPCFSHIPHNDRHNIQTYIPQCLNHLDTLERMRKQMEQRRKELEHRAATTLATSAEATSSTTPAAAGSRKRKFGSTSTANIGISHEV